jgi:hypothetical protein
MAVLIWRQLEVEPQPVPEPRPSALVPTWLRALLAIEGVVMLGVGVVVYVAPAGAAELWPWTVSPLTARAMASFVIGFGAAAALAALRPDLRALEGSAYAYATLGALELVALVRYGDTLDAGAAGEAAFIGFAVLVLLTGLAGAALSYSSRDHSSRAASAARES